MKAFEIAGTGAIRDMLLVLGMQLADFSGRINLRLAIPAISLRLVIGPMVALLLATMMQLHNYTLSAGIIEASISPAAFTIILATEFGLPASVVTSIVVIATRLSLISIAATISLLGL